ncbi:hypothetical protein F4859DRAFT_270026 [Xylaria cf. heliscus]|nr:hypothetical protein F4859DRAFT_270026 [Xylaria cf. heliscus]
MMLRMIDTPEGVQPINLEPNLRYCCSLCKKTFEQEATAKRHYYYCRSKPADTKESRRRSCTACVRAKARCIWPADSSIDACTRCNKRNVACEYDAAVARRKLGNQTGKDAASATNVATPVQEVPNADIQESSNTALVSTRNPSQNETTVFDPDNASYLYVKSTANRTLDNLLISLEDIGLDIEAVPYQGISSMSFTCTKFIYLSTSRSRPPAPWNYLSLNTPLFTPRAFTRRDHVVLVSLAMRILRSYPMMTTKGSLPPFVNPSSYSWAQLGGDHKLHKRLITCSTLIPSFISQKAANKTSRIWGLIWHEQELILAQYSSFDRWELLDALQTLLIFCLLRIQDVPVGHAVFDISLLTTANLVSQALGESVGQHFDCALSGNPTLAWRDWVFLESRRRTVLIFQILGLLVDISAAVSYFAIGGLVLVPLPGSATLWNTQDFEKWKPEYRKWHEQRMIYGLSETGSLAKLQITDDGISSKAAEWEGWSAEVGDLATLVMIIGELLKNE